MKTKRLFFFSLIAIVLIAVAGIPTEPQLQVQNGEEEVFVAGRNVNMVSGTTLPDGDPYLQRQNEPSLAVSSRNPLHLLAGANDYRTVDMPIVGEELPGIEEMMAADAWLGYYTSDDGGESWKTSLLPGFPQDISPDGMNSPLKAYTTAADPWVCAGSAGRFYYSGLAFNRGDKDSAIFVARFEDTNDKESGDTIEYRGVTIVALGNAGQFVDMPRMAVDVPRGASNDIIFLVYTVFVGNLDQNIKSKMYCTRSTDGGLTWSSPTKLSESQHIIQGANIGIDPINGDVYVAFRRFYHKSQDSGIVVVKSTDRGSTFSSPQVIATFVNDTFDQPATANELLYPNPDDYVPGESIRTNSYPAIAVDDNHRVYVAWSQRNIGPAGAARIVMKTSVGGSSWSTLMDINPPGSMHQGHEFMPQLAFGAGKLTLVWYDQRSDWTAIDYGFEHWIGDWITNSWGDVFRHTIDVWAAQVDASNYSDPTQWSYTQVSRYLYSLLVDENGDAILFNGDPYIYPVQFNCLDYPMFKGGTLPFMGDYIALAASPTISLNQSGNWVFNTEYSDNPVFHAAWTDNRDVRPPAGSFMWTDYTPADSVQDPEYISSGRANCSAGGNRPAIRNQNIYTAKLSWGIVAGSPTNEKSLDLDAARAFVIFVQNNTEFFRRVRMTITEQPLNGEASFLQFDSLDQIFVTLAPFSTASRQVFIQSTNLNDSARVDIVEVDAGGADIPGGLTGYVIINGDPSNDGVSGDEEHHQPQFSNPNIVNWVVNPNIVNPNIVNPNIVNPNIVNPNIVNPNIVNPNIVNEPINPNIVNPNIVNPNIVNPNIVSPNIVNPNIVNPNIVNPNIVNPNIVNAGLPGDIENVPVFDVMWTVTNEGNTVTTYTLNTVAEKAPPEGIYTQLLIYRVHKTPSIAGEVLSSSSPDYDECTLYEEPHHELILNIVNPNIVNPNIVNLGATNASYGNPNIVNESINNATFSLGPGEEVLLDLRVLDTEGTTTGGRFTAAYDEFSIQTFDIMEFISSIGFVVTSMAVDSDDAAAGITTPKGAATDLYIVSSNPPDGVVDSSYTATLTAFGGTAPYNYDWSLNSGELPPGLMIGTGTSPEPNTEGAPGTISGTPTTAGTYVFMVQVTDDNDPLHVDTQLFSATIFTGSIPDTPIITTTSLPSGVQGKWYGATLHVAGGNPPFTWSWTAGSTPTPEADGLILDPTNGIISGTPTSNTTYNFDVTVTDRDTQSADVNLDLVILESTGEYFVISGTVYDGVGGPLDGVHLYGLPNSPMTDTNGYYEDYVPEGWEGVAIPFKIGHAFDPTHRVYTSTDTVADIENQNYNQPIPMVMISGTVNIGPGSGVGIQQLGGVTMVGLPGEPVTDVSGYYEAFVPVGWSGTATPTKDGYIFEPISKTYELVAINQEYQDYEGVEGWISRYHNESATNIDMGFKIATDIWGNLYVSGMTDSSPSGIENFDTITFKHDPTDGSVVWNTLYDRYQDNPMDIGVFSQADDDDYVFVAAFPYSGNYSNDFATLRYSGTTGFESWRSIYNYVPVGHEDEVNALAVDAWGDVYVTGMSDSDPGPYSRSWDYATIKYDGDTGAELWASRYEGANNDVPLDIIVDALGNVYVTGYSNNGLDHDIRTIKYDRDGTEVWNQSYDSSFGDDMGTAMALDPAGYVYVAAEISSDTNGTDFGVVKYDLNGNFVWVTTYNNAANNEDDSPEDMAIDGAGNIYVTGTSDGGEGYDDIFTVKFIDQGPTAAFGWGAVYDGPDYNNDRAVGLVIDPHDQIYITGESRSAEGDYDYVTIKYKNTGANSFTTLWTRTYDSEYGDDSPRDIALCTFGNIYLTGESEGDGTSFDFATLKYSQFFDSLVITSTTLQDGVVDTPYAAFLDAFGSSGPRTWSIASGSLPPGIGLESSTGIISGLPSATGTFDFGITVQDGVYSDTKSFSIEITSGPLDHFEVDAPPAGYAGTPFSITVTAKDISGNTTSHVTGDTALSADPSTITPDTISEGEFTDDGVWTGDVTLSATGSINIVAANNGKTGSDTIVISALPTVQFSSPSSGADEATTPVSLELSLSSTSSLNVTVEYQITGGTATGGGVDYTLAAGTAEITAGELTTNISVNIIDDLLFEPPETVEVTISNPSNATLGANIVHTLTIVNNDPMPSVSFTGAPYAQNENLGATTIMVTMTGASSEIVEVNYATSDGTAIAPSDYAATSGTLTWNPGETGIKTFDVTIIDDVVYEGNESLNLTLSNALNCTITPPDITTLTILDNESPPPVEITTTSIPDGVKDTVYSATIEATGGVPPLSWSILSGTIPAGLDLISGTGELTGTPTESGYFTFTVQAEDSLHQTVTQALSLTVAEWVATYNGPFNGYDEPSAIAVDVNGNVYVTGKSYAGGDDWNNDYVTIKYDKDGNPLWTIRYDNSTDTFDRANALAVDALGNVYVTGGSNGVFRTIKYDPDGIEIWNVTGPSESYEAVAIAIDSSGNVYATGTRDSWMGSSTDYYTIKYDKDGNELWVTVYNGPGNDRDDVLDIAVDLSGNVYVTGWSVGSTTGADYCTVKYDGAGNEIWVARFDGGMSDYDEAHALAVDSNGNVFVTGYARGPGGPDYYTIKYNSAGTELWVRNYNGPGNHWDVANDITVDPAGNVYVTGSSTGESIDYATVKYDTNGNELWVSLYNGPDNENDSANTVTFDPLGNIYVTGRIGSIGGSQDFGTVAYDNSGNELWTARFPGATPVIGDDWDDFGARAIALDSLGNVFVTGRGDGVGSDYATVKYSQSFPDTLLIGTNALDIGFVGTPYAAAIWAFGGSGSRTWSIASGSLPPGIELESSTGIISGLPSATGTFDFGITVQDGVYSDTKSFSIEITSGPLDHFEVDAPPAGYAGTPFSITVTAKDISGNTTSHVTGDTALSADPSTITPDTISEGEFTDDGVWTGDVTLSATGSINIVAANNGKTGSDTIVISALPTVQFSSPSSGADEATTPVSLELSLSSTSSLNVTVEYQITGGTATGGGVDYTLAAGTAEITAGELTTNISVNIIDDLLFEPPETVEVTISNPSNATLGANIVHTLTIVNNDPMPSVSFTGAPYAQNENLGATTIMVTMTGASSEIVEVNYATSDGTAIAPSDYAATSGTLTWNPGETGIKTFDVTIIDDVVYEGNESLNLTLSNALNCTITPPDITTLTILDNESPPPAPTQVELTGPSRVGGGFISEALTLTAQDDVGTPTPVAQNTVFDLSSDSSIWTFFSDPEGTTPITQVTILTGQTSITFYYMDNIVGTTTVTAAWASGGTNLGSDTHQITVWAVVGEIAFQSNRDGDMDIYIMNVDGSGQTNLMDNSSYDYSPSWSPDGRKIAFTSNRDGNQEVYVMNADGSWQTNLTNNSANDYVDCWSPDGSKILFTTFRGGNWEIYVMNADGSGQTNLTKSATTGDQSASWSPDGSKIVYTRASDGFNEIYVMDADGTNQTELTNGEKDYSPSWSPDGSKILFYSLRDGQEEIYVMDADGTNISRLTTHSARDQYPCWSPDGSKIAFASERLDNNYEIYIMDADGTNISRLTNNSASEMQPSWCIRE